MNAPHDGGDHERFKRRAKESMRNAAVVLEAGQRAADGPEDVDIRHLGGKRHGKGRVGGPPIETGAGENGAAQKMCDRFHAGDGSLNFV